MKVAETFWKHTSNATNENDLFLPARPQKQILPLQPTQSFITILEIHYECSFFNLLYKYNKTLK